jgi:hypothetical protein
MSIIFTIVFLFNKHLLNQKNSRFKSVVSIELKISDSINFEFEIFNSIKTTNFVIKSHLFEENLIIIIFFLSI